MLNHYLNLKTPNKAIIPERKSIKICLCIRNWLFLVLCSITIITTSGLLNPYTAVAASKDYINENYIFDKVITWHDGSSEHVQIGADGFFRLDGEKKRLVGIYIYQNPYRMEMKVYSGCQKI